MYKYGIIKNTTIQVNNGIEGETIEQKVRRITTNKEPITDGAPEIFTERGEGVKSAYNIRTDRWEVAIEAMDAVNRSILAKRDAKPKMEVIKNDDRSESSEGKAQSIQGTTE